MIKMGENGTKDIREDGYYNLLNNYGSNRDSTEHYQWHPAVVPMDAELASMYAENGVFATIIDAPADDAVKNGIDFGMKDSSLEKKLSTRLEGLKIKSSFAKALKWARLFGGSIVVMLVDDGRLLEDPLNWRDVRGVEELLVYGRNEVSPIWLRGYQNNPASDDYRRGGTGVPEYYQVSSMFGSFMVHSSRCLTFHNTEIPDGSLQSINYRIWGVPEYSRMRDELKNVSLGGGYAIRLLERLSMIVYKMRGLGNLLSTPSGEEAVLRRIETIDKARNILNILLVDAEGEDIGVQSLTISGIKDILDNACAMLSAVSRIPQTRLFGRSPAGENATGEGDLTNYKEYVAGIQSGDLLDNTRTLVKLVLLGMQFAGEITDMPEYTVTYNDAWSLSDGEKATKEQTEASAQLVRAQTAEAYINMGVYEPADVRTAMSNNEKFDPENIKAAENPVKSWGLESPQPSIPAVNANPLRADELSCGYVAALVVKDGKVLCGLRSDGQGWCGPGGHIEPGETPLDAVRREANEEFGITLPGLRYAGNCGGKPDEILPVQIYICESCPENPQVDNDEILECNWFTVEQIMDQDVPGGLVFDPFKRSVEIYLSR